MDNRQRYDYDRQRDERDERDYRNENWRGSETSGRDFMTNQPRYGSQGDYGERDQDRGRQGQWSRNPNDDNYRNEQNWQREQPPEYGSRQVYRTGGGQDRGWDRNEGNWEDRNRDWNQRNLPENYRQAGREEGRFSSNREWGNERQYTDPYRENQGSWNKSNRSDWGSRTESGRYEPSWNQNRGQEYRGPSGFRGFQTGTDFEYGANYRYGSGPYDRNRSWTDRESSGRDYGRESYGREDYGREQGREETLTEKVGRFFGMGPKGYRRSDERIREDISERLEDHPEIDATNIEIQVREGEVTLTGSVDNRRSKRLAEDVAEQCRGVKDVHNQIRVTTETSSMMPGGTTTSTTGTETTGRRGATGTGTSGTDKTRAA